MLRSRDAMMQVPVAIASCPSYGDGQVERAVREAVELAGGFECRGASVLLKPNVLSASLPEKAVTTHPEVFRAFARLCKDGGASRVLAGDSPGWQAQDFAARGAGLLRVASEEGVEWVDFSDATEIASPRAKLVRSFTVARTAAEVDLLVTLPKLKTHSLMYYTGATKNLFGVVPGFSKSAYHLRFPSREDFGAMILDLCLALEPAFALMDAVVAMEGPGPGNGRPRHLGLVLASRDPVALDVAGAALIGYDPRAVSYLRDAGERGLVEMPASKGTPLPSWVGVPFALARAKRFELVERPKDTDFFVPRFPRFLHDAIRDFVVRKPRFSAKRCIACGGCVRICPAGALVMGASREGRRVPMIDDAKCVLCYCCHEICPEDAIALRRSFARKAGSARSERKA